MSDEFAPPAVPKSDNSTGPPTPPSGSHPADPKPAVITNIGGGWAAGGARRVEYSRSAGPGVEPWDRSNTST